MEKLFEDKRDCCGCGACEAACPRGAVAMRPDGEGFLYPAVDAAKCVGCGLCEKVCPIKEGERWKAEREPRCFTAIHKSDGVLMRSTSGGAFTALSDIVLARGGAVCGADFDENLRVVHKMTDTAEGRDRMRVSKYVQSNMRGIFRAVREECGKRPVFFTGTPCQCAALLSYLGGRPENLFVCDLICHSIPSPLVWRNIKSCSKRSAAEKSRRYGFVRSAIRGAVRTATGASPTASKARTKFSRTAGFTTCSYASASSRARPAPPAASPTRAASPTSR